MVQTVIVTSINPRKADAAREAFIRLFPDKAFFIETVDTKSIVPQPRSINEAKKEAHARVERLPQKYKKFKYIVSLESGIEDTPTGMLAFEVAVVKIDNKLGEATSLSYYIPEEMAKLIREGYELGDAHDKIFGITKSKFVGSGVIGKLTNNVLTRSDLMKEATIGAIVGILGRDL